MGGVLLGHILRLQGISFMDNFPFPFASSVLRHSLDFPGPAVCSPAPWALRRSLRCLPSSVPNSPSFLFFGRDRQDRGDGERLGVLNNEPHLFLSAVGSSRALGLVYKRPRV